MCIHVVFLGVDGNPSLVGALLCKVADEILQIDVRGWDGLLQEGGHFWH